MDNLFLDLFATNKISLTDNLSPKHKLLLESSIPDN